MRHNDVDLGVGRGRLFTSSDSVLDRDAQLGAAKLQTGDCLTLQVGTIRISSGFQCFAAILGDGSVVAWGKGYHAGSSCGQEKMKNVQQNQAFGSVFAAILGDGSVVT